MLDKTSQLSPILLFLLNSLYLTLFNIFEHKKNKINTCKCKIASLETSHIPSNGLHIIFSHPFEKKERKRRKEKKKKKKFFFFFK